MGGGGPRFTATSQLLRAVSSMEERNSSCPVTAVRARTKQSPRQRHGPGNAAPGADIACGTSNLRPWSAAADFGLSSCLADGCAHREDYSDDL